MTGTGPARRAVVVGAGIGGLAAAVGLRRGGWTVTVLERTVSPGEVGAGLSLWSNALRALDALGLGTQIRAVGTLQGTGGVRTSAGRWLSRSSAATLERRGGVSVLVVHRADLHRRLREALPEDAVVCDAEVTGVEQDADGARVLYRTGVGEQTMAADLVVGADGLESAVRQSLWPDAAGPDYAGFSAWRGVTAAAVQPAPDPGVSLGRASEFGVVPMADGRVYWFGTANLPAGRRFDDERAEVRRRFSDWHPPIPALIDATSADAVLHHDIRDLVRMPPALARGRVALLGDAAHAMTPNLGQGACLALEDAVELAAALAGGPDVVAALRAYAARRRPRVGRLARASRRLSRVAQHESRWVRIGRDTLLRLAPAWASALALRRVTGWSPPPEPAGTGPSPRGPR